MGIAAGQTCALGRIRTCGLPLRRRALYPLSYEGGGSARCPTAPPWWHGLLVRGVVQPGGELCLAFVQEAQPPGASVGGDGRGAALGPVGRDVTGTLLAVAGHPDQHRIAPFLALPCDTIRRAG